MQRMCIFAVLSFNAPPKTAQSLQRCNHTTEVGHIDMVLLLANASAVSSLCDLVTRRRMS
eukprot:m.373879 g.373879  ORF g.373879 m.373879 type:complete len:60 (+) comp69582_c0_seq1:60-239(+)